jgi:ribonuclease P/MRP protein subunit RPP1
MAVHLGYGGLCIYSHPDLEIKSSESPASIGDKLKIFRGMELRVSRASKLHGLVGKYRKEADIIAVHGGTEAINRAAVENPGVDILNDPFTARDSGINHILAKSAAENGVALSFDVGPLIRQKGGKRISVLSGLRQNLMLVRKFNVPVILTTGATSAYGLRAPREVMALAGLFGMTPEEARGALSTVPDGIISGNRTLSASICNGVRIIDREVSD